MTLITELQPLTFVADSGTPASLVQYNGKVAGIPPDVAIPVTGVIFGIPGYRTGQAGAYSWVMTGPIDVVANFVDTIPGGAGWKVPAARTTWINTAKALLGYGVTTTDLVAGLPALYSSAVTNYSAP